MLPHLEGWRELVVWDLPRHKSRIFFWSLKFNQGNFNFIVKKNQEIDKAIQDAQNVANALAKEVLDIANVAAEKAKEAKTVYDAACKLDPTLVIKRNGEIFKK